ncbi:hypothetical protein [Bdellovibrio svalbardensis]|uniref:Ankyrin repeat domain-containing protein n=1 Tax=Bdellovibrio svalbardensis TaxID=2972972 RepID=A0ABT6DI08_9BACT|nr:hypothetical protein [Bdellovibrio svalbardensis]MDG0815870.1 hypothetical protein [Bdellovibrio svalbardensis]
MQKIVSFIITFLILSGCTFRKDIDSNQTKKSVILNETSDLPLLTSEQNDLFDIVEFGKEAELELFLNQHPNLNLNFLNKNGKSPLQIAVSRTTDHHFDILIKYGASLFWDLENTKNSDINNLLTARYRLNLSKLKETDTLIGHAYAYDSFFSYKANPTPLELVYEKIFKEIVLALEKNDLLSIQKIQKKNIISCNLLSAMFIESFQFPSAGTKVSTAESTAYEFLKLAHCAPSSNSGFSRIIYNFEWLRLLIADSDQTHILDFILDRFPTTSLNIEDNYVGKLWVKVNPEKVFTDYRKPLPETLNKFLENHRDKIVQSQEEYLYNGGYHQESIAVTTDDCFIFSMVYGRTDRPYDCPSASSFEPRKKDDY